MQTEVSTAALHIVGGVVLAAESPAHLAGLQTCGALLGSILPVLTSTQLLEHQPACRHTQRAFLTTTLGLHCQGCIT